MKILIACERSGIVRDAFIKQGHDAVSCDLVGSDAVGPHIIADALELARSERWDMMVAFPPCTHLSVSGARWFAEKRADGRQQRALQFVRDLMDVAIERIAIENPASIISTQIRKPSQIIQPWQYGHGETKATCLWLQNLPLLWPTEIVAGREQRVWKLGPSPERAIVRGRTYQGIADAMAKQWSI